MKVLLVEDDSLAARLLSSMLSRYHYTVEIATDGQQGFELADQFDYDLILLDVQLPKLDGVHLCQRLRVKGCSTPILMLTACDSSKEIIQGLDAGADDYVLKPYEPDQLAARIRSLLRRREKELSPSLLQWGNLRLNYHLTQVTYQDHAIHLTPKEYGLLELFLRHPQRVFSRSTLLDLLWRADDNLVEGTVTNLIKDLRRKLRSAGISEEVIETVHGLGYRLKAFPQASKQIRNEEKNYQENEPEQSNDNQTDIEFSAIVQQFRATLDGRISLIDQALEALLKQQISPEQQQQAQREAHQLIGTLGFFGYGKSSETMRSIEEVLQQETSAIHSDHISQLRIALKQITVSPDAVFSRQIQKVGRSTPSAFSIEDSKWEPRRGSLIAGNIIVVDDDAIALEAIAQILQPWGFRVSGFTDAEQFWQQLSTLQPDLILLDLQMPRLDGIELCQRIRQHSTQGNVPLLMVTAHTDRLSIQQIFAAGADDFISKPVIGPELVTRVSSHLQQRIQHPSQFHTATLAQNRPDLDLLTQLKNRTCFEEKLSQGWRDILRSSIPCTLLLADIDHFKRYNHHYSYRAGDACLQLIAQVLQKTVVQWNAEQQYRLRSSAQLACFAPLIARYRDDEFALWLPYTNAEQAVQMAKLLSQNLAQETISRSTVIPHVTLSLGITTLEFQSKQIADYSSSFEAIDKLITIAEQALQTAKQSGDNTYCLLPFC